MPASIARVQRGESSLDRDRGGGDRMRTLHQGRVRMSGRLSGAQAAILGAAEGLTEHLPVSSTAHIDLAGHWLGVADVPGFASFDIVIQLGAILAVLVHYRALIAQRLAGVVRRDPIAIRLWLAIAAGFIPTAVIGLLLHKLILRSLFGLVPIPAGFVVGGVVRHAGRVG